MSFIRFVCVRKISPADFNNIYYQKVLVNIITEYIPLNLWDPQFIPLGLIAHHMYRVDVFISTRINDVDVLLMV